MSDTTKTRICIKCPERGEQSISKFHRRGGGYQNICKTCRNEGAKEVYRLRGKSRLPHSPTSVNTANFEIMSERISTLESKLRSVARAFSHDKLEADDIYSEIVQALLTRCKPEDNESFLLRKANWIAQAFAAKKRTHDEYMEPFDFNFDARDGEHQTTTDAEKVVFKLTNTREIEDEIIQREAYQRFETVIESLPIENQKIIALLSVGLNQKEIAAELHVSQQSINDRVRKIRLQISAVFDLSELALQQY